MLKWCQVRSGFNCLMVLALPAMAMAAAMVHPAFAATATPDAAVADTITNSTDLVRTTQIWASQNHLLLWLGYGAVASMVLGGLYRFGKTDAWAIMWQRMQTEVLTNWRLTLLAVTSLALTLASGWTTWDGMTNFTGTPLLSFLRASC
jgi:hypothetical protein